MCLVAVDSVRHTLRVKVVGGRPRRCWMISFSSEKGRVTDFVRLVYAGITSEALLKAPAVYQGPSP